MSDSHDLHQQIHNITELNNVLGNLLSERSLCDMEITAELFFRYIEAVKHHLQNTESAIFARLLVNADDEQSRIVDRFIDGSSEIKQIFASYTKKWCRNNKLFIRDYELFHKDTVEVFELVLRRVKDETEKLYPLVKAVENTARAA